MNLLKSYRNFHSKKEGLIIKDARKGGIWAVYRLFNRYYLKSFFGPFFSFVFPVVIYAILGSIMNSHLLFAGIIAMSGMSAGITGLPFSVLELKKSVLLKRIGASPVKPSSFTIVIITYFFGTIMLSSLWMMIWSLVLFQDVKLFNSLGTVTGFFGFFYGNILNIILSISVGFAISSISKSEMQAQAIGMLIYFPSTFLSGQFLSIDIIAKNEVMNWISRVLPFRYTTMVMVESWTGDVHNYLNNIVYESNAFAIHDYYAFNTSAIDLAKNPGFFSGTLDDAAKAAIITNAQKNAFIKIYMQGDHIAAYVVPYTLIAISTIFSMKKFSWSAAR